MLKRDITYTDFNDQVQTETLYFHISKSDLVGMKAHGVDELFERIMAAKDNGQIYDEFKKIILSSYGERSEDGKSFVKTPEISEAFSHTAAFDALIFELITNEDAAATFIKGVMPNDLEAAANQAAEEQAKRKIAAAQATVSPTA